MVCIYKKPLRNKFLIIAVWGLTYSQIFASLYHSTVPEAEKKLMQQYCPNHTLLPSHASLQETFYYATNAEVHINVNIPSSISAYSGHHLMVFELPALPPFVRNRSPLYANPKYDIGEFNWGFTATYIDDFAHALIQSAQLIGAVQDARGVLCVYRSMLESYKIDGRILIENTT